MYPEHLNHLYKPPLKRRRLSSRLSQSIHQYNGPQHTNNTNTTYNASRYNPMNHNFNPFHQTDANYIENEDMRSFKSQLKEILELFPPFMEFIATQRHPNDLFEQLYQTFTSCTHPQMNPYPHTPFQPDVDLILPSRSTPHRQNELPPSIYPLPDTSYPVANDIIDVKPAKLQEPSPNAMGSVPLMEMDDDEYSLDKLPPNLIKVFNCAKDKMLHKMYRNMELRCNKVIQSLNKTTKNNAKCCAFLKQFTMDVVIQRGVAYEMSEILRIWHGGKCLKQAPSLNEIQAFKIVRGHWNRLKAQVLGDSLYCLVLRNLFKIATQIPALSMREQLYFYLDLFCELLSDQIQFEQSMPRPLIPNACFDKSMEFKKLCENILDSFSKGKIRMMHIQTTATREENGKKVTKYIRHGNRSKYLAQSYLDSLQELKPIVMSASNDFIQHSIQIHLRFLRQSPKFSIDLIRWGMMAPDINLIGNARFVRTRPTHCV